MEEGKHRLTGVKREFIQYPNMAVLYQLLITRQAIRQAITGICHGLRIIKEAASAQVAVCRQQFYNVIQCHIHIKNYKIRVGFFKKGMGCDVFYSSKIKIMKLTGTYRNTLMCCSI